MKVLLVNPPRFNGIPVIREERCEITERYSVLEPYSLLQIAAELRHRGHLVHLVDLNGFNLPYNRLVSELKRISPEAVIFRFTPTTFDWDMKTAEIAKSIDGEIKTIGICWTLRTMHEIVMANAPHLDIYVRHEYETTIPNVIDTISSATELNSVKGIAYRDKKGIGVTHDANSLFNYDSLPLPAYDLLPNLNPYFVTAPAGKPFTIMYTSKGCPFRCSFCTVAGTAWKPRSAEKILEELRFLKEKYKIRTVSFFDETFTLDRKRVEKICKNLIEENLDIQWYCNTRAHLVDRDLLFLMRRAGCTGISYGIESGSQKILDYCDKSLKVEQGKNAINWAKEAGIKTFCSFILGLPGEDWSTINETFKFVNETLPTSAQFNVAVPYPGTRLFEQVKKEYPRDFDFRLLYQDDAIVGTESLSPADLNRARKMAYKILYFNPNWWISNIRHVMRNPKDLQLALVYALKIADNYLIHGMKHAH
ncbi:MAG: B12-binding domain-containing radical SAM protein [Methanomassiliicoccales archaeon]|nr:B12-binding domain-containing radical SAM protein [Methanomassiliicoccales archaeon]